MKIKELFPWEKSDEQPNGNNSGITNQHQKIEIFTQENPMVFRLKRRLRYPKRTRTIQTLESILITTKEPAAMVFYTKEQLKRVIYNPFKDKEQLMIWSQGNNNEVQVSSFTINNVVEIEAIYRYRRTQKLLAHTLHF